MSNTGEVEIGGSASWRNRSPRVRLNITGKALSITQPPVTSATVNPDLRITFENQRLAVTGDVEIPEAFINIKELPAGTSQLSSDVVVLEEVEISEAEAADSAVVMDMRVDVSLKDNVRLSGYGLDASLVGDVRVSKNAEAPVQLDGEILIKQGTYKSYGQNLLVEDGQLLFVGPIEQTRLAIDATRRIDKDNVVAGLRVEGKISDPTTSLFSEPADLTQERILSYLILGRDLNDNSGNDEDALLASAALALTLRQSKGVTNEIAENLGISDFAVETGGNGDDTELIVSGRLSDRLLLKYGRSVFQAEETLFLRYDISRRLYLEAARGVERAVDLFYTFSF